MNRSLEQIKYQKGTEEMARFAKAFAHPTRIAILRFIQEQKCCFIRDLVDEFPIAQSTISQHVKELKEAGLIHGTLQPPKIKYCLNQENWKKVEAIFSDFFNNK